MPLHDVTKTGRTEYVDLPHTYICGDDIELIITIVPLFILGPLCKSSSIS